MEHIKHGSTAQYISSPTPIYGGPDAACGLGSVAQPDGNPLSCRCRLAAGSSTGSAAAPPMLSPPASDAKSVLSGVARRAPRKSASKG